MDADAFFSLYDRLKQILLWIVTPVERESLFFDLCHGSEVIIVC